MGKTPTPGVRILPLSNLPALKFVYNNSYSVQAKASLISSDTVIYIINQKTE